MKNHKQGTKSAALPGLPAPGDMLQPRAHLLRPVGYGGSAWAITWRTSGAEIAKAPWPETFSHSGALCQIDTDSAANPDNDGNCYLPPAALMIVHYGNCGLKEDGYPLWSSSQPGRSLPSGAEN